MSVVSQKLRDSARGQLCTMRLVCSGGTTDTTILAHLRTPGAAGGAQKPDDWHAVFACSHCHTEMDTKGYEWPDLESYMLDALRRTQRIWWEMGLLKVPETKKAKKPSSKIMPRGGIWPPGRGDGD